MPRILSLFASASLSFASFVLSQSDSFIVSGAAWTDASGDVIQAHGAGLLTVSEDTCSRLYYY